MANTLHGQIRKYVDRHRISMRTFAKLAGVSRSSVIHIPTPKDPEIRRKIRIQIASPPGPRVKKSTWKRDPRLEGAILEMHGRGMRQVDIAKKLGILQQVVSKVYRKHGCETLRPGVKMTEKSKRERTRAGELYGQMTMEQIADELGRGIHFVYLAFRYYGLKCRIPSRTYHRKIRSWTRKHGLTVQEAHSLLGISPNWRRKTMYISTCLKTLENTLKTPEELRRRRKRKRTRKK